MRRLLSAGPRINGRNTPRKGEKHQATKLSTFPPALLGVVGMVDRAALDVADLILSDFTPLALSRAASASCVGTVACRRGGGNGLVGLVWTSTFRWTYVYCRNIVLLLGRSATICAFSPFISPRSCLGGTGQPPWSSSTSTRQTAIHGYSLICKAVRAESNKARKLSTLGNNGSQLEQEKPPMCSLVTRRS